MAAESSPTWAAGNLGHMDRDRFWRVTGPRVSTIAQAARFIRDVGFAHLFPGKTPGPSLWSATAEHPERGFEWGTDAETVWAWKDELPARGDAWFGLHIDHKVFLSPTLLAHLYPGRGRPDDYSKIDDLSDDASALCKALERSGALSQATLKEAVHLEGKAGTPRFNRAVKELGRNLMLTHRGIEEQGAGWPSAVLDLTSRVFEVGTKGDPAPRRAEASVIYLATMHEVTPRMLGRAFGWRVPQARTVLRALEADGRATSDGDNFTPVVRRARRR